MLVEIYLSLLFLVLLYYRGIVTKEKTARLNLAWKVKFLKTFPGNLYLHFLISSDCYIGTDLADVLRLSLFW